MTKQKLTSLAKVVAVATMMAATSLASAVPYFWTDWTGSSSVGGFTATGEIVTNTATINVTYNNPLGIAFIQTNGGTDYWTNGGFSVTRNAATSAYTSTQVDNIPTGTDIVALLNRGSQTLAFSQAVANPVFSFVSLNGNGYSFLNQDFEILSVGGENGRDCGYWGCGGVTKVAVDLGGGNFEYQLNSTGIGGLEPHGTIRFLGSFDTLQWTSQSNENWNGFTVGIQGSSQEVFRTPEPGSIALFGLALLGLAPALRKKAA